MVTGPSTDIAERVIRQHINTQPRLRATPDNQQTSQETPKNAEESGAKPTKRRSNWWLIGLALAVMIGTPIVYALVHT